MPSLHATLDRFRDRLSALVREHAAPGVSFAVGRGDDLFTAAAGIANLNTGLAVTSDTKFLIGSNTKAMTITLMCRAADDGLVDLDERVLTYLPGFRTAEEATTQGVTVRHLLLHTNGIGGDFAGGRFFPYRDFGRGDEAMANLVESLPEAGIAHPLGLTWSYSNAAYVVAGRILEVVHGKPYATVLRERLLEPLGMVETALTPEESMLGPCAVGHESAASGGGLKVTSHYLLPQALAPAGAIVNCTARDLVRFGRMFLNNGSTASGEQLLQERTVAEMLSPALRIPQPLSEVYMCLSMLYEPRPDHKRYRSSGGTTGQWSLFHLLPEQDLVLVALGNGPGANAASAAMFDEVVTALTGLEPPGKPVEPDPPADVDLSAYVGSYASIELMATVTAIENGLKVEIRSTRPDADGPQQELTFRPIGDHQFIVPGAGVGAGCTFLGVEDGRAEYLWMRTVWRRVAEA